MRRFNDITAWFILGVLGLLLLVWAFPRAFPFYPKPWTISRTEARDVALAQLEDLGEPVPDPYVVTRLISDTSVEQRLRESLDTERASRLRASQLGGEVLLWEVVVYGKGAAPFDWTYRAEVGLDGKIRGIEHRLPREEGRGVIGEAAAREQADAFLRQQGFDLAAYEAPESRSQQLQSRTDTQLRYKARDLILGDTVPYGVEVKFSGEQLTGFLMWSDDPQEERYDNELQAVGFLTVLRYLSVLLLFPVVGIPFLKRYHAGEIGVHRGLQILAVIAIAGLVFLILTSRSATQGSSFGIFNRQQTTWLWGVQLFVFFYVPIAALGFMSWAVGESACRERWGDKLAAFDALFQFEVFNATVARAALRGTAAGFVLAGGLISLAVAIQGLGASTLVFLNIGPWWDSGPWPGVALLGIGLIFGGYAELFGRLFLVPTLMRGLGRIGGGALVVLVSGLVLFGTGLGVHPLPWTLVFSMVAATFHVFLFLRYGILTTVLSAIVCFVVQQAYPLVVSDSPAVQIQGALAVVGALVPLLLTARHLGSDEEFQYRYEDVPPHVRRIADRERQRVELETARRIQSSILPELPPRVNGVDLAHAYLPATEVGGDFYDVLGLEDGRLAVAVGDVAGHGVSSGLVMSMAKSALAVQVTFNPEVRDVFATLNRMVFQSARKRLLTTLCYALVDPRRGQMEYASAGHLFPYLISGGEVQALESVAYPLGVRGHLEVRVRTAPLRRGDCLFLFSDGVVEAHGPDSDDLFGFPRLEAALQKYSGNGVAALRDGVLAEVQSFIGVSPRADDLTILVLQIPE